MAGYGDGHEGEIRKGLGDLVDETVRFYSSNHEAIDSEKQPEFSQYQNLINMLNERGEVYQPRPGDRHLFAIHAMSGSRR